MCTPLLQVLLLRFVRLVLLLVIIDVARLRRKQTCAVIFVRVARAKSRATHAFTMFHTCSTLSSATEATNQDDFSFGFHEKSEIFAVCPP